MTTCSCAVAHAAGGLAAFTRQGYTALGHDDAE